jgi:hypothetical protein
MRNVLTKKIMFTDPGPGSASGSGSGSVSSSGALLSPSSAHSLPSGSTHATESTKLLDGQPTPSDEESGENSIATPSKTSKPTKGEKGDGNPAESFYLTSLIAAYFMLPFWLLCSLIDVEFLSKIFSHDALLYVLLSGLMHASYNLSSFGFLSRVSTPTTHAIANVFKRVFTIWSAIVFFGATDDAMTPLTIGGLAVATAGLFWYGSLTASNKKS